jgi:type VI secretion system protein ImpH
VSPAPRLVEDGPTWSFVRAVEAAAAGGGPIGTTTPPAQETVRLRPVLGFAFPTSDIARVERLQPAAEGEPARLRIETTFLGSYGPASPLPSYATEALLAEDSGPARDFIDIFNHRMLSLAWRVLTKYRVERSRGHADRLRALAGAPPDLPEPALPGEIELLSIAGLLAQQPRSASALATALSCWLGGVPVEIEQCAATWTPLPAERQARGGQLRARLGHAGGRTHPVAHHRLPRRGRAARRRRLPPLPARRRRHGGGARPGRRVQQRPPRLGRRGAPRARRHAASRPRRERPARLGRPPGR